MRTSPHSYSSLLASSSVSSISTQNRSQSSSFLTDLARSRQIRVALQQLIRSRTKTVAFIGVANGHIGFAYENYGRPSVQRCFFWAWIGKLDSLLASYAKICNSS
ncbi:hypothetical protein GH714_019191 [Hevea brasiliensis]|uniref:Uncharacterized protein n=1 Tax=Hevea brasiliensis TaxID=3981 RepID=A0A6A6N6L1_HEVBR|nr:hypothetical protein GH714_019191 [Hevea brasiliensis]